MAAQGRLDEELLAEQRALAEELELPYQAMCVNASRGLHALAAGAAEDAARELGLALAIKRRCGIWEATTQPVIGADIVEALVRCGRRDEAAAEAAALGDAAARAGGGSVLAVAERARAVVAEDGIRLRPGLDTARRRFRPIRPGADGARVGGRAAARGAAGRVAGAARGCPGGVRGARGGGVGRAGGLGARPQREGASARSGPAR